MDNFLNDVNTLRISVKIVANDLKRFIDIERGKNKVGGHPPYPEEIIPNLMLSYRHLEDASMRLGKAIQAYDGGVSVYDKETTVGVWKERVQKLEQFIREPIFTKEQFEFVVSLAQSEEKIPICVLLVSELNVVSEEDIAWGRQLVEKLNEN